VFLPPPRKSGNVSVTPYSERVRKNIRLCGRQAVIYGISKTDPYFKNIHDEFEHEFYTIAKTILPVDGICMDIGANIGITTFIMSRCASQGKILSVEAGKNVSEILAINMKANRLSNVMVKNAAVADFNGEVDFTENSAYGHIETSNNNGVKVQCFTLKNLMAQYDFTYVDLIKIDTEGYEFSILQSCMPEIAEAVKWLFIEFNSFCLSAFGNVNPKEFLNFIFSNYKYIFKVAKNDDRHCLRQLTANDLLAVLHENIVKNGSVDNFLCSNSNTAMNGIKSLIN
jgi:FkbM family methyltransferase